MPEYQDHEYLLVERDDSITTITLNRAQKRNALNTQMRDEISAALKELEDDDSVSVAVLAAAGPVFCSGFDTKEFETMPPAEVFASESSRRYHHRVQHFKKPLVAAINGPAMGGGFDLAVLCDVRIAAETAAFGHPEIKFGAPALYGPLAAVIGGGLARDLCLSGRRIDAQEALRIGLVSAIVAADRLLEQSMAAARTIAEAPAATLQGIKSSILEASSWKFDL